MKERTMKKILVCLLLVLLVTGCGSKKSKLKDSYENDIRIHYEGVDITPGQRFDPSSISKEPTVFTSQSCAFDGEDKVYNYGNVEFITNVRKGYELIYSVYILDETVENDENIKITDNISEVNESYSKKYRVENEDGIYTVTDGVIDVKFVEDDNKVISIAYSLIVE